MSKASNLINMLNETISLKLGDYITGKSRRDRIGKYLMFGGTVVGRYYFKDDSLILDKPFGSSGYGPSPTDDIRDFAKKNNMKLKVNYE